MDIDDVIIWPDGCWCFGYEIEEYSLSKSDDVKILKYDTDEYYNFLKEE